MTPPLTRFLGLLTATLCVLPLSACAKDFFLSSPAIEGKVVEVGTNKPVPGAIVVVRWQGHLAWTGTVCYHVESTTTDPSGSYRVPAWQKPSPYGDITGTPRTNAYKPGYEEAPPDDACHPRNACYLLKPSTQGRGERLKYLLHISGLASCYGAGDEKAAFPFYKALYNEAKKIEETDEDKDITRTIRRRAALAWVRVGTTLTSREVETLISNDPYLKEQLK